MAIIVVIAVIGAGFVLMQQPAPQQTAPPPPPQIFVPQEGLRSSLIVALNAKGDINLTAAAKALSGEGIIADKQGRLYTADRVTTGEVYMIDPKDPKLVTV
ncbi:MAG: hypothetical protein HY619_06860, partial [Thaumarchaeota archaeon]|nr:hypothetical protein [Nitrososphaerota archaeon]